MIEKKPFLLFKYFLQNSSNAKSAFFVNWLRNSLTIEDFVLDVAVELVLLLLVAVTAAAAAAARAKFHRGGGV